MSTNLTLEQRLLEKIRQLPSEKITEVEQLLDFLLLTQSHKTQNPENLRPFALCRGEFAVPKEFNDLLPEDILLDFEYPT